MNRGSSTLKSALYEAGSREELLLSMTVDQAGASRSHLKIAGPTGTVLLDSTIDDKNPNASLEIIFDWSEKHGFLSQIVAAGHRLVQGGPKYRDPQLITAQFLSEMEQLVSLDPDHMEAAIQGIRFVAKKFPKLPQVACFDTAFHSSLPQVARMYALPRRFYEEGIARYGFHGLSYEYIMGELHKLEGRACQRTRDYCAPGQRRQHGRGQRREKHRHLDGLHASRRVWLWALAPATSIPACCFI